MAARLINQGLASDVDVTVIKKKLDGMSHYETKTHENLVNVLMRKSQGFHAILTGFP